MCDFQGPPKVLVNLRTGRFIQPSYNGTVDGTSNTGNKPHIDDKGTWTKEGYIPPFQTGIYHVCCTGGHYRYWDGYRWNHIQRASYMDYYIENPHKQESLDSYNYFEYIIQEQKHEHILKDSWDFNGYYWTGTGNETHIPAHTLPQLQFRYTQEELSGIFKPLNDIAEPKWNSPYIAIQYNLCTGIQCTKCESDFDRCRCETPTYPNYITNPHTSSFTFNWGDELYTSPSGYSYEEFVTDLLVPYIGTGLHPAWAKALGDPLLVLGP